MGSGIGYKGGMILRIAQNLLWRAYQIVLVAVGMAIYWQFIGARPPALIHVFGSWTAGVCFAFLGTVLTVRAIDSISRARRNERLEKLSPDAPIRSGLDQLIK